ncbi:MAG: DUF3565 domain-containing protein [Bryobacteraceae bacterium]
MTRPVTGFHQDEDGAWVLELECGHQRHARHAPPGTGAGVWFDRAWVTTPEGRASRLGMEVDCAECSDLAASRRAEPFADGEPGKGQ